MPPIESPASVGNKLSSFETTAVQSADATARHHVTMGWNNQAFDPASAHLGQGITGGFGGRPVSTASFGQSSVSRVSG
jgi:hypothetical protein